MTGAFPPPEPFLFHSPIFPVGAALHRPALGSASFLSGGLRRSPLPVSLICSVAYPSLLILRGVSLRDSRGVGRGVGGALPHPPSTGALPSKQAGPPEELSLSAVDISSSSTRSSQNPSDPGFLSSLSASTSNETTPDLNLTFQISALELEVVYT